MGIKLQQSLNVSPVIHGQSNLTRHSIRSSLTRYLPISLYINSQSHKEAVMDDTVLVGLKQDEWKLLTDYLADTYAEDVEDMKIIIKKLTNQIY